MTTFTAFTTLDGMAPAERLGAAMEGMQPEPMGVGVFDLEDGSGLWEVGGYFRQAPDQAALMLLAAAFDAREFVVSEVPQTNWVAHVKRQLSPVRAGRFFVYGSHDVDQVPEGSVALLIEAAMAFGTGHHGTTQGCLRALERLVNEGFVARQVADIGCGTAVLAMAAARVFEARVLASDVDPVAVEVAQCNVAANRLGRKVKCVRADGLAHPALRDRAPFDLIFANIVKGPLIRLAPGIAAAVGAHSKVILSGLLAQQCDDVVAQYSANGFQLQHREDIVEWSTLTLGKISA
ncbi:MAG: 50S ribosomal protein L11 methyltransferase [Paracoccaceae bacterium]